jgi:hypothetical protein
MRTGTGKWGKVGERVGKWGTGRRKVGDRLLLLGKWGTESGGQESGGRKVVDRLLLLDMTSVQQFPWHSSASAAIMTNGLPSKPIPPSWPAPRPFVLRGQPPAASLDQATASRAARETSGAFPPAGNSRRGRQTSNHPTTAPHKPPHHGHRPTTSAQESTTSPQALRPTRPHRVTLLPTLVAHSFAVPCRAQLGLRARPQADAASTRSTVPDFGVRGFSFDHPTPCKAHPQSPKRQRRVGPHRQPNATTAARAQNLPRPNADAISSRKLSPADRTYQSPPKSAQTNPIPTWRKAPALPRTESSVLRPTGHPNFAKPTQFACSRPHARIHICASLSWSHITKHETRSPTRPGGTPQSCDRMNLRSRH